MNYIDELTKSWGTIINNSYPNSAAFIQACSEVDELRNELIKKEQELLDYSEDFAFLGLPHGSKEEKYLIQSDKLHKMRDILTKIFTWWDLHDGHLMTAFNTPVSKEMGKIEIAIL